MPSAPQDHRPPRPLRSTPLRRLPDPTSHPIVPAANLGWERNWQEEQPGSEFEGRWLMVPVFVSGHSPHMIIFNEKGVRRNSLGWTTRRRCYWSNDKPASMTAGEYQRWLRDHEREIDQWYELTNLDIPERPSWEGYWEEYDTGTGPDYQELIRRWKAEPPQRGKGGGGGVEIERMTFTHNGRRPEVDENGWIRLSFPRRDNTPNGLRAIGSNRLDITRGSCYYLEAGDGAGPETLGGWEVTTDETTQVRQ